MRFLTYDRIRQLLEDLHRRAEVDAKDHEEFQGYLAEKKEADARKKAAAAPTKSRGISRRTMFNAAVGTAVVAEAGVLGYNALGGGSTPSFTQRSRFTSAAAARGMTLTRSGGSASQY